MPPFPKPETDYDYDLEEELKALREHRNLREIPEKTADRLLIATWNIANFGVQHRREKDIQLLAEIIGWFDLVAVQEVARSLKHLDQLHELLPDGYRRLISDTGGNDERTAFLFDSEKVDQLELVGRFAVPPADYRHINLDGVEQPFLGFDRTPYIAAFQADAFRFTLASVHLFYGSEAARDVERRALEAYAVARWADLSLDDEEAYARDVIALGDFNLPQVKEGDPIFEALTQRGLKLPPHPSVVGGTSLGGHKHYDQIAFFPGETEEFNQAIGVFDFDNCLFREHWNPAQPAPFLAYCRYYVSDHRPLWAEFKTG
ncbi:MAG: endonuclease/exonuclease/phosphatase family protein [Actinomycetota bacterium]|nr:endonuclease/exonuclease/phosphatase family protein [Actinomycetota bacterium]